MSCVADVSTRLLRAAATRAHVAALRSLVQSAYPTASVLVLAPSRRQHASQDKQQHDNDNGDGDGGRAVSTAHARHKMTSATVDEVDMRQLLAQHCSGAGGCSASTAHVTHARVSCVDAPATSLWRALYACGAPLPPHHDGNTASTGTCSNANDNAVAAAAVAAATAPLCAWSRDAAAPHAWLPCWVPHAIVYIGGVEAADVRRTVAPRLFDEVPDYNSVPCLPRAEYTRPAVDPMMTTPTTAALSYMHRRHGRTPRYVRDATQRAELAQTTAPTRSMRHGHVNAQWPPATTAAVTAAAAASLLRRHTRRRDRAATSAAAAAATTAATQPLLLRKGCAVHDDTVLELSLPVCVMRAPWRGGDAGKDASTSASASATTLVRVRTLVTIANPDVSMRDVHLERDLARRAFMRGGFGYVPRILHDALPHAVVDAVRLLLLHGCHDDGRRPRRHGGGDAHGSDDDKCDGNVRSACVRWLSLLGHVITDAADEVHATMTSMQRAADASAAAGAPRQEQAQQHKDELQRVHDCLFATPAPLTPSQMRVLSLVLARTAARLARRYDNTKKKSSSDVALQQLFASNYFLPGELPPRLSMQYLIISNVADKVSLYIDDDMTVGDVRGLVRVLLDVDDGRDVAMTYNGRLLRNDELSWPHAIGESSISNKSSTRTSGSATTTTAASAPRKLFCRITAKATSEAGGVDALRIAARQQMQEAGGERERRAEVRRMEPLIDAMVQSPGFVESMLGASPQVKQLLERHPEVRRELANPETLKMMLLAQLDPSYRAQMGRSMELQLAQLNLIPGAQQMLDRHVHSMLADLDLEGQRSAADLQLASEEHARPEAGKEANSEALPNPWSLAAQQQQQQQQQQQGASMSALLSGDGGAAPAAMLSWADAFRTLPAASSSQVTAPVMTTRASSSSSAVAVIADRREEDGGDDDNDVQRRYAAQLGMLADMGFADVTMCVRALRAANGDVEAAVAYIAQWQDDEAHASSRHT